MKRLFNIAAAGAFAACLGLSAWSYGSQGGGAGGTGGGGAGAAAGAAGTSGTAGAAGTAGNTGTNINAGANINTGSNPAAEPFPTSNQGQPNFNGRGARADTPTGVGLANRSGFRDAAPFFADPTVRRELQLTDQQFNQLNAARQAALARLNQSVNGLGASQAAPGRVNPNAQDNVNLTPNNDPAVAARQRAQAIQEFQNQFNTDMNAAVNSTFTDPAMRQRFNQLNFQFQGLSAFSDPAVRQQLNLTPEQTRQLARLNGQFRREMNQLLRSRSNAALTQQQLINLRAQFMAQASGLLTADQQQLWTQITGQPFNFPGSVFLPGTDGNVPQVGLLQQQQPPVRQPTGTDVIEVPQPPTTQQQPATQVR